KVTIDLTPDSGKMFPRKHHGETRGVAEIASGRRLQPCATQEKMKQTHDDSCPGCHAGSWPAACHRHCSWGTAGGGMRTCSKTPRPGPGHGEPCMKPVALVPGERDVDGSTTTFAGVGIHHTAP